MDKGKVGLLSIGGLIRFVADAVPNSVCACLLIEWLCCPCARCVCVCVFARCVARNGVRVSLSLLRATSGVRIWLCAHARVHVRLTARGGDSTATGTSPSRSLPLGRTRAITTTRINQQRMRPLVSARLGSSDLISAQTAGARAGALGGGRWAEGSDWSRGTGTGRGSRLDWPPPLPQCPCHSHCHPLLRAHSSKQLVETAWPRRHSPANE